MKVKIVMASKSTYWYASHIGEVFEVEQSDKPRKYAVVGEKLGPYSTHYIDIIDTIVVMEAA